MRSTGWLTAEEAAISRRGELTTIYRLLADPRHKIGNEKYDTIPQKGMLVFAARSYHGHIGPPHLTTTADGQGVAFTMPEDQIEPYRDFDKPQADDFEQLFRYYFKGNAALPNQEPITDPQKVLAALDGLALGGWGVWPESANLRLDDDPHHGRWARIFLAREQFGGLSGSGIAIVYQGSMRPDYPRLYRFALCKHERVSRGGNPARGYSPGRCTKCGLDMTVDSSD